MTSGSDQPGAPHRGLIRLERLVDRLRPKRLVGEKSMVRCFEAYGRDRTVIVRGRVEMKREPRPSDIDDSRRRNFLTMAANFFTREIPHARIYGEMAGQTFEATADDEGYFLHRLELANEPADYEFDFSATVSRSEEPGTEKPRTSGMVLMVRPSARRVIISDVDDTVIETGAAKLWQLLKTTLLENEHTRRVFEGVSTFYTDLQRGGSGNEGNPIYYVTSSPWNLRDFLIRIFELRSTPRGPLFMTDWGIDRAKFFKPGHHQHKLQVIRHLLEFHDPLPAVLIGDSGEQDPEIYSAIVREHPGRVAAIFIRDVTGSLRATEIARLAEACVEQGVPLHLVEDTHTAVREARAAGLVP